MTAENRAAIRNLPEKLHGRFIDTGITEQTMIGMAAGLALCGKIPVVHALATFLTMRAFEFIRTDIGISGLPVKLIGGASGLLSEANGPTHQALEDLAIMRGIPGMHVFCPADEDDMMIGLPAILGSDSPCYIRYTNRPAYREHDSDFTIGKAEVIDKGFEITFITYGCLFAEAFTAYQILKRKGYSVGLINMRMLQPFDDTLLVNVLQNCKLIVSVEDHFIQGGLFSLLAETAALHNIHAHIYPIGFSSRWFTPCLYNDIIKTERLQGEDIAGRIEDYFTDKISNVQVMHAIR